MNRRTRLAVVILFICALTAVGVIASIKSGLRESQNSQSDCEQACRRQYQDCIGAPNANRPQCQQVMQGCRSNCRKNSVTPSPTAQPTATVEPTATATPTATSSTPPPPTATPTATMGPRPIPSPRPRPTPAPRASEIRNSLTG